MVWAREGLSRSHGGDRLQDGGLLNVAARRSLQHVHQVRDEEVVLERGHPLLGQDGGLAAHGTGEGETVGGNVVLQTPVAEAEAGGPSAEGAHQLEQDHLLSQVGHLFPALVWTPLQKLPLESPFLGKLDFRN